MFIQIYANIYFVTQPICVVEKFSNNNKIISPVFQLVMDFYKNKFYCAFRLRS